MGSLSRYDPINVGTTIKHPFGNGLNPTVIWGIVYCGFTHIICIVELCYLNSYQPGFTYRDK